MIQSTKCLDYLIKISTDGTCAREDEISNDERLRRQDIMSSQFYVNVFLNGQRISSSKARRCEWPTFEINLDQHLELVLLNRPKSVMVQIMEKRPFYAFDRALHQLPIPIIIPGGHHHHRLPLWSVRPTSMWYQFASPEPNQVSGTIHIRLQWSCPLGTLCAFRIYL